ncbi:flagellar motor protein MotB [Methylomonas lenta]|uniref:Flagellar motor protein MotB n=1 Tax=Methylomonas lenta TaxID=980561 RepID=A0A177N869_9GAMM|nr:OmpA family protein [Methylomonas lenta]OAI14062.1 flagellar motor protein MotB [Methylomonas lenta]
MLKKGLLAFAALSTLGVMATAQAEEFRDDRFYVAPFGSFVQPAGDRSSNNGWGGGMGFGKILNEHLNIELKGFWQGLSGDQDPSSWEMMGGMVDTQYYFFRDTFSPYAVVGLGGMNTNHGGRSAAGFIGEVGAGVTYELHDNFLIRSDVRYRYNNNFSANMATAGDSEFNDMTVNLGFVIPIGPKPAAPVVAKAPPPPAPAPVVADCSTLDTDKDGVNNCNDKCPGTLPGVEVSVHGCWILEVLFDNDKDIIKPQYFHKLDHAAETIKKFPNTAFEVQGHTSKTGTYKHNLALSERRALAVQKYLTNGSHSPNITSKGYSWDRPIDTNETEEGRANNRRVQLEVNGQLQEPLNR